jgi:hypothetical protein
MTKKTPAAIATGAFTAILFGLLSANTSSQAVADWPWDIPCSKGQTCLPGAVSPDGTMSVAADPDDEEDEDWPWD